MTFRWQNDRQNVDVWGQGCIIMLQPCILLRGPNLARKSGFI